MRIAISGECPPADCEVDATAFDHAVSSTYVAISAVIHEIALRDTCAPHYEKHRFRKHLIYLQAIQALLCRVRYMKCRDDEYSRDIDALCELVDELSLSIWKYDGNQRNSLCQDMLGSFGSAALRNNYLTPLHGLILERNDDANESQCTLIDDADHRSCCRVDRVQSSWERHMNACRAVGANTAISKWVVILGAGQDEKSPDGALELVKSGYHGVLFEGDPNRVDKLRKTFIDRQDVFIFSLHVRPSQVALLVQDAMWAYERRLGGCPDYLQIDVDNGDCDFLEAYLRLSRCKPETVSIEVAQSLIPPDVVYWQHYTAFDNHSIQSLYSIDGGVVDILRGCSLGAVLQILGSEYSSLDSAAWGHNFEFLKGETHRDPWQVWAAFLSRTAAWHQSEPIVWGPVAQFDVRLLIDAEVEAAKKVELLQMRLQRAKDLYNVDLNVTVAVLQDRDLLQVSGLDKCDSQ